LADRLHWPLIVVRTVGYIPGFIAISAELFSPISAQVLVISYSDAAPADHARGRALTEGAFASFECHGAKSLPQKRIK